MFNSTKALRVGYKGIPLETLSAKAGGGYGNTANAAGASLEKRVSLSLIPHISGYN